MYHTHSYAYPRASRAAWVLPYTHTYIQAHTHTSRGNITHLHVSRQLTCTPHTSQCHNAVPQFHAPPCEQAISPTSMSAGSSLVHHTRHNVTMQYHKSTHLHVSRQYHTPPCQQAAHTRHNVTMQHHNFTHLHVSRQLACTPHTSHCHNAVSQIHAPPCEQAIISHTSMSAGSSLVHHTRHNVTMQHHNFTHLCVSRHVCV